jgi:hypothetical protein
MDRDTIDVSLVDYNVTSEIPLDETLRFCANHVAEGRTIVINQAIYLMKDGKLGAV